MTKVARQGSSNDCANTDSEICLNVASSSYVTALYFVSSRAAQAMVKDDYFRVAEVFPGKAVLFVGAGEFRKCDIGPYRELYMGFYTQNREQDAKPTLLTNVMELLRNQSKMLMWRNWLSSDVAMKRMERAGATIFRKGDVQREDTAEQVTLSMRHPTEGAVRITAPKQSRYAKEGLTLHKTHYGRLHGRPARAQLDLHIDRMTTSPLLGELELTGQLAEDCRALGVPKKPLASVWIEEMRFVIRKPVALTRGAHGADLSDAMPVGLTPPLV